MGLLSLLAWAQLAYLGSAQLDWSGFDWVDFGWIGFAELCSPGLFNFMAQLGFIGLGWSW